MSRNNLKQGRSEQLLRLLMSDIAASCGVGAGSGAVIALERKETVERGIQEVYLQYPDTAGPHSNARKQCCGYTQRQPPPWNRHNQC